MFLHHLLIFLAFGVFFNGVKCRVIRERIISDISETRQTVRCNAHAFGNTLIQHNHRAGSDPCENDENVHFAPIDYSHRQHNHRNHHENAQGTNQASQTPYETSDGSQNSQHGQEANQELDPGYDNLNRHRHNHRHSSNRQEFENQNHLGKSGNDFENRQPLGQPLNNNREEHFQGHRHNPGQTLENEDHLGKSAHDFDNRQPINKNREEHFDGIGHRATEYNIFNQRESTTLNPSVTVPGGKRILSASANCAKGFVDDGHGKCKEDFSAS